MGKYIFLKVLSFGLDISLLHRHIHFHRASTHTLILLKQPQPQHQKPYYQSTIPALPPQLPRIPSVSALTYAFNTLRLSPKSSPLAHQNLNSTTTGNTLDVHHLFVPTVSQSLSDTLSVPSSSLETVRPASANGRGGVNLSRFVPRSYASR